jgi:glycerophosphoryl diester phosphodiesterase
MSSTGPIVVAHRGWWRLPNLVENSLQAFARAVACGFPAECDVWPSADGEPVVIHDETLDRTTTARGKVALYRADHLRQIRLRAPESDMTVPLLKDIARLVNYVEVKAPDSPEFVRRVIQIMDGRDWMLQSFDEKTLHYALEQNSSLAIAYLTDDPAGIELALNRGWALHADHQILNKGNVARFRERGLRIGAWTVNGESDIHRVLAWGLDVIISDEPKLVREMLAARDNSS